LVKKNEKKNWASLLKLVGQYQLTPFRGLFDFGTELKGLPISIR
jgi:hypothetical protein